jgi:hypothetical protein
MLAGSHIQSERCGEENRLFPLPAIESRFTSLLAHNGLIISTALSKRVPVYHNIYINYINIILVKSVITMNGNFNRITELIRCLPPSILKCNSSTVLNGGLRVPNG